jgi:hypothetical protein
MACMVEGSASFQEVSGMVELIRERLQKKIANILRKTPVIPPLNQGQRGTILKASPGKERKPKKGAK